MTGVDRYAEWDGAYVLGALDPDERREFESHLTGCEQCRSRVDELRPTVTALALARVEGLDPDAAPMPATLLPAVLRHAQREHARRRRFTAAIGLLAAACLVALAIVAWPASNHDSRPAPQALHALQKTPVAATARLVARPWGTEVDLHCTYKTDFKGYFPYELRIVDRAGEHYDGGSWALTPGRATDFVGGASVALSQVRYVQITLADGTPILQLAM